MNEISPDHDHVATAPADSKATPAPAPASPPAPKLPHKRRPILSHTLAALVGLTLGAVGQATAARMIVKEVHEPQLCELDGGRWCSECEGDECADGSSGWLCCSGDVCVAVNFYADCTIGVCGWCNDYTESLDKKGNTIAACHD